MMVWNVQISLPYLVLFVRGSYPLGVEEHSLASFVDCFFRVRMLRGPEVAGR